MQRRLTRNGHREMTSAFPSAEAIEAAVQKYVDQSDEEAVYKQLVSVAVECPGRTREYARVAAKAVAVRYCTCTAAAEPFDNDVPVATKRKRAADPDHPGLCGKQLFDAIASVKTEKVEARGSACGKLFRCQVSCLE